VFDGVFDGAFDGVFDGASDGAFDGAFDGVFEGAFDGVIDGAFVVGGAFTVGAREKGGGGGKLANRGCTPCTIGKNSIRLPIGIGGGKQLKIKSVI